MHGVPTSAVKIASGAASLSMVAATNCGCSGAAPRPGLARLSSRARVRPVVCGHPVQVAGIGLGVD